MVFSRGETRGRGARPRRRRRGFPRSVRTHRPTSSAMSQPMNRWNMPIARLQEMRGISEGPVSSSSSRAPCKSGAEEDLVSAEVLSAAMVASVEGEGRGRGRAGTAREREARGERRRRGQESRTSRGAGWESSAKGGGVRVSSPAFSRGDGGEVDEGGDDDDGACVRARGIDSGRDTARRHTTTRRPWAVPKGTSFSERPRFRVVAAGTLSQAARHATRAGLRAFPLRVRLPLPPLAAQHAARWRSFAR